MRLRLISLLCFLTLGCKADEPLPRVDRIELRQSGESSVDVEIDRRGVGRYRLSDYPKKRAGSFTLTAPQHAALLKRLERFQREAEPMTEESKNRILDARCPDGVPYVTDAPGFWIHWIGPNYNRHYAADFDCDYKRNRARNDELRDILHSLPIPATS